MAPARFHCDNITEPITKLVGSEAHHLASVCRLGKGQRVELFDGKGTLATAIIEQATTKKAILTIEELKVFEQDSQPRIIIAAAIAKGERFDWLIGKCTELGVDRITPVIFERTVKQPKNPKVTERWRNIAIAAAKQCRRIFLPQIDRPMNLSEALSTCDKAEILVGSLELSSPALIAQQFGAGDVIAVIGPEGGITEAEKTLLENCRAKFVRLTNTVLRIETAALAFAAVLTAMRDNAMKEK